jgi:t-SNARE complex subunit (syntaxin)
MKGVDYTKQLQKDHEYFNDTIRKTQVATDRKIADTNERAEYITKKQRDNFIEDKAELETSYQKNLEKLSEA